MTLPRILVGCPTSEVKAYALPKYLDGLQSLTYPDMDILIEDNSQGENYFHTLKEIAQTWNEKNPSKRFHVLRNGPWLPKARDRIVRGRNALREYAIEKGYDYFFSLEQDVIPPAHAIERLLENNKPIVSGVYFTGFPGFPSVRAVAFEHVPPANPAEPLWDIGKPLGLMQLLPSRLIDCAAVGLGCILLRREVVEKVSFRYDPSTEATDDMFFSYDARKNGHTLYLDSSILCQHYFNAWGEEYRKKSIY